MTWNKKQMCFASIHACRCVKNQWCSRDRNLR